MKYKVKSPHFKDFNMGDIIELFHNKEQYSKAGSVLGSPAFTKNYVENSPEFFEPCAFSKEDFVEIQKKLNKFNLI
jgi:hypothetical protein